MYKLLRPLLFTQDAEKIHNSIISTASMLSRPVFTSLVRNWYKFEHTSLETEVFGLRFKNPVGLAPGFDKSSKGVNFFASLGFGFIEVGTVTPLPQPGNEKPRMFRLPQELAMINRMGFNSVGAQEVARRLKKFGRPAILGINLGKNKQTPNEQAVEDYKKGFAALAPLVDFAVINVSSPNTPGLRLLQDKEPLKQILEEVQKVNQQHLPVLLKISPDLNHAQLDDIVDVALETKLAGIIATNTLATPGGGLSGLPIKNTATDVIRYLYKQTNGFLPIIGVGGIFSAEDAYEKIKAGASLIQIYTGFIYEGPSLVKKIKQGLVKLLQKDGFENLSQAVGKEASP